MRQWYNAGLCMYRISHAGSNVPSLRNKYNVNMRRQQEALLRRLIRETISDIYEGARGGGLTDHGAARRINPAAAAAEERSALVQAGGDTEAAAKILDVSPSRMYDYIQDSEKLQNVQDTEQERSGGGEGEKVPRDGKKTQKK